MTRSHTAKNNNTGMSDKRYGTRGMNNNTVVTSSPSKMDQISKNDLLISNNQKGVDGKIDESHSKQPKSNASSPTKKSLTNSILSYTTSILAAAAASASSEANLDSREQSPTKDLHKVIDLTSNHSSPLKRMSTPSSSPTRRGGRATKPSPHQGTPPQSPPTPHKIICQATVETIGPTTEAISNGIAEEKQRNSQSTKHTNSPNKKKLSGSKLISALTPKKNSSSTEQQESNDALTQENAEQKEIISSASEIEVSEKDEGSTMPARRNLTNSFLNGNNCEASVKIIGATINGPKNG